MTNWNTQGITEFIDFGFQKLHLSLKVSPMNARIADRSNDPEIDKKVNIKMLKMYSI